MQYEEYQNYLKKWETKHTIRRVQRPPLSTNDNYKSINITRILDILNNVVVS